MVLCCIFCRWEEQWPLGIHLEFKIWEYNRCTNEGHSFASSNRNVGMANSFSERPERGHNHLLLSWWLRFRNQGPQAADRKTSITLHQLLEISRDSVFVWFKLHSVFWWQAWGIIAKATEMLGHWITVMKIETCISNSMHLVPPAPHSPPKLLSVDGIWKR